MEPAGCEGRRRVSLAIRARFLISGVRVHKFKVGDKQYLLAYTHEKKSGSITLLALGSHENFYRDLSR